MFFSFFLLKVGRIQKTWTTENNLQLKFYSCEVGVLFYCLQSNQCFCFVSLSVCHWSKWWHFGRRQHSKWITSDYNPNDPFHHNFLRQYLTKHTAIRFRPLSFPAICGSFGLHFNSLVIFTPHTKNYHLHVIFPLRQTVLQKNRESGSVEVSSLDLCCTSH